MKKAMLFFLLFVGIFLVWESYIRLFKNYNEPYFDNINKIIKRKKSKGKYKTEFTNTGYFRINNEGWNSSRDYFEKKEPGKCRVAVVGHSDVEGLRVPVDKIFSNILEKNLLENGKDIEIYTFGFAGMHIAQALHVSRYVLRKFHPDILVIGTLLDNFLFENTDQKYFLSLKVNPDGKIEEILPVNANVDDFPLSFLYFSKGFKYIDIKIGNLICNVSKNKVDNSQKNNHFLQWRDSGYKQECLFAIDYLLQEFLALQKNYGNKILFIDFPDQVPSYNQVPLQPYFKLHNAKILERKLKHSFSVVSLDSAFKQDYQKNWKKFDFPNDRHYNQYAHELIGITLSKYFIKNKIE